MNYVYPALGAAVALAGADKLVGQRGYERMFAHLGWTEGQMRAVAAVETVGGLMMMMAPATRRLGGAAVASASATLLSSEMRHGDPGLAAPRALVLLAGLAAALSS